jgi:hypothetical protein
MNDGERRLAEELEVTEKKPKLPPGSSGKQPASPDASKPADLSQNYAPNLPLKHASAQTTSKAQGWRGDKVKYDRYRTKWMNERFIEAERKKEAEVESHV